MKKALYIFLFGFLGLILATLLHAIIELPALWILTSDIERYGDSFVWQNWELLHGVISLAIWVLGLVGGVWVGFRYWRILYIEQRRGKLRF